jgi:hypothetical protein
MQKQTGINRIGLIAVLLVGAMTGCGREQAANISTTTTAPAVAPTVSSTNPANFADCEPLNQAITATFSKAMDPLTINMATFLITGTTPVTGAVTLNAATNTAIFTPSVNLPADTVLTATITTSAKDTTEDPLATSYSWSFETCATPDTTAPTVISTFPATSTPIPTGVALNTAITATFSEGMNPATLIPATFTVTGPGVTPVTGTVTYAPSSNTATFAPAANLAPSTTFTATITTGAKDLAGNALAANYVWMFTTGAAAIITPPTITLTFPANGAMNVPLNTAVDATFSKPMDPTTLTTGTFTLVTGGASVTGTVTYNAVSNIATFTPATALAAGSTYTATITGAKDLAGNGLASGTIPNPWTFQTGSVTTGPTAVSLGSASTFGDFGGAAGMTNSGTLTVINGDIGTTGVSTTVTGFHDTTVPYTQFSAGCIYTETPLNVGRVNGTIYTAPPPPTTLTCPNEGTAATFTAATNALADARTAYNTLAGLPATGDPGANLGGIPPLPAGVWKPAGGSLLITGGDLTLDGQGNANAVWVFQMASSLTVGDAAVPRNVLLINGAQAKNVFWQVGSSATINAAGGGTMVGTIISYAGTSFSTAGKAAITTLNGRVLALNASVTVVNTVVNVPLP